MLRSIACAGIARAPIARRAGLTRAVLLPLLCCIALIASGLAGCGGSEERTATSSEIPLEGKKLGKESQIVGTWMRLSEGNYTGFEFLKDGKVLATTGYGTATLQYDVLDGGRVSLTESSGRTHIFRATLADDLLELSPEASEAGQKFKKVDSGMTLVQAVQEHAAKMTESREKRLEAVRKLMTGEGLVLTRAEDTGPPAIIALKIDHFQQQFNGTAIMVEEPANVTPLAPVRIHPVSGRINPVDDFTDRLRITLQFAPATAPEGQQDKQGRIILLADGPTDSNAIHGNAEFPKSWMGAADFVLKRDSKLHSTPIAKLEEQEKKAKEAVAKVSKLLEGRAHFSGTREDSRNRTSQEVELVLERVAEGETFTAVAVIGKNKAQKGTAGVRLLLGAGALYVDLPNGEQWRLQPTESGADFTGAWRPNVRSDFISYGGVALVLEDTLSIAEVKAENEAKQRFLTQDLLQPVQFKGFVESTRSGDKTYWPVWVELQANGNGSVAGKAWLLGQQVGVGLKGSMTGEVISLEADSVLEGSANKRNLFRQRWQLSLDSIKPLPTLSGHLTTQSGGPVQLTRIDSKESSEVAKAALAALRGKSFTVVNYTISRKDNPSYFRFDKDSKATQLSGDAVGEDLTGSRPSALPPGVISGTLVEEHGHTLLKLTVAGAAEPTRARDGESFTYTLAPRVDEDGQITFWGWDEPGRGNQTWLGLTPVPQGTEVTVSPEQKLRLAAQREGAIAKAPTDPKPGDSVVLIVNVTERDARVGQLFYSDGKYTHRNSVPAAVIHAGLANVGEVCVVRLDYGVPFTAPVQAVERNGIASQAANFRATNPLPTFTISRLSLE